MVTDLIDDLPIKRHTTHKLLSKWHKAEGLTLMVGNDGR